MRAPILAPLLLLLACSDPEKPSPIPTPPGPDPEEFATPPRSCSLQCPVPADCTEINQPYECPSLGEWSALPHADACPAWDGKPPAPRTGKCFATDPSGDAIKTVGKDPTDPTVLFMPDGHKQRPFGKAWTFPETEIYAGMTSNVLAIPNTSLAVTVDTGYGDHAVRLIDTDQIGTNNPTLTLETFPNPEVLNWGMAYAEPNRLFVATDNGVVQAFTIDTAAKTLSRDNTHSITLPKTQSPDGSLENYYTSGLATSTNSKYLIVSPVEEKRLLIFDIDPQSPTLGQQLGSLTLPDTETFGVYTDPNNPLGDRAYVSMWQSRKVLEINLENPTSPTIERTFAVEKNPQGIAFLNARYMVVANDLGDTLSLIDRITSKVTTLPIDTEPTPHGSEPSTLAYDPSTSRLYVVLAALSTVAAYNVDLQKDPPAILPEGRLQTLWWPSGIALQQDGSLLLSSLRGDGTGPALDMDFDLEKGDAYKRLSGGIQKIPMPTTQDLIEGEAWLKDAIEIGNRQGSPKINCPNNENDFPVPETNEKPSPSIDHIFIILRENKSFDGLLGDLPNVNGDPSLTLKSTTAEMEQVWPNLRALASRFAISDNFYTSAEISSIGHVWDTYGRSNDYNERTWAMAAYGRSSRPSDVANGGVADVGRPEEGSLFQWLSDNNIPYDIMGEAVGLPENPRPDHPPIDFKYPGGFIQNMSHPDIEKGCHIAGRAKVLCNLGNLVFMTMPNDHTLGLSPNVPIPEQFCAVNDEGTGIAIEAISKSPLWPSSLILVTEDDTAQGGDHVDQHRTIFVAISPWVKQGYVSKTLIDIATMHKLIAHIFGLPYPNLQVKNAALPLDMFTSTPNFNPYTHIPRKIPMQCGDKATKKEIDIAATHNRKTIDQSPSLDEQTVRWMRGQQLN